MEVPPPAVNQLTLPLECSKSTRRQPQLSIGGGDPFDARMVACVRDLVHRIVRAPHLSQEREDCMQEACIRFWQAASQKPARSLISCLRECRGFIRDMLKRGKSVDSPKRRWLGYSIDSKDPGPAWQSIPELVSEIDPEQQASASDALERIRVRLNPRGRTILQMFLEGSGAREIARRLHISPSAVGKSRLRIRIAATQIGLSPPPCRTVCQEKMKKKVNFQVYIRPPKFLI
jgi:RNA polymerase sigma factor (sigma-70 family)